MDLELVTSLCGTGTCPTVYLTDHDTVVVQGPSVETRIAVPDGEVLVEIPVSVLLEAVRKIQDTTRR